MAMTGQTVTLSHYPATVLDTCDKCHDVYAVWSPFPGLIPYSGQCSCKDEFETRATSTMSDVPAQFAGHATGILEMDWGK